jgi:membrane protein YdbS with pleckstrin-like domain
MDEISKKCLKELSISILWRVSLCIVLHAIALTTSNLSFLSHLSALIIAWIVGEVLFIFIPNLIRHRRRWSGNSKYRSDIVSKAQTNGALRTIYSRYLDEFSV